MPQRTPGFANPWGSLERLYEMSSLRGHRCDWEGWSPKKTWHRHVSTNWVPRSAAARPDTTGQRVVAVQGSVWGLPWKRKIPIGSRVLGNSGRPLSS